MFNIVRRLNRNLSTIKKVKLDKNKKKHKWDIENEKWVDTKDKGYYYVYLVTKVKRSNKKNE